MGSVEGAARRPDGDGGVQSHRPDDGERQSVSQGVKNFWSFFGDYCEKTTPGLCVFSVAVKYRDAKRPQFFGLICFKLV